jgi:hypothetical protein
MEAAGTSEMSVNVYQATRCYNPKDSHLNPYVPSKIKHACGKYSVAVTKQVVYNKTMSTAGGNCDIFKIHMQEIIKMVMM